MPQWNHTNEDKMKTTGPGWSPPIWEYNTLFLTRKALLTIENGGLEGRIRFWGNHLDGFLTGIGKWETPDIIIKPRGAENGISPKWQTHMSKHTKQSPDKNSTWYKTPIHNPNQRWQQRELRPNQSPKRDLSGKAEPRQNQIKKPDPPQTKETRYHDSQTLCLSNPYNTSFEIISWVVLEIEPGFYPESNSHLDYILQSCCIKDLVVENNLISWQPYRPYDCKATRMPASVLNLLVYLWHPPAQVSINWRRACPTTT